MNTLYPLKFQPVFKDKIWGGRKIKDVLGMNFGKLPNCGEAWVVSGVEGNPTLVKNGFLAGNELNELVSVYMGDLVGDDVYEKYGDEFPLLIKYIDANDWLSIQVHPDDELAAKRKIGRGKTEMWYIMEAEKEAELISGFRQKVDKDTYQQYLNQGKLQEILNFEKVEKGDVFFIPAGRVHALGPGILLAEIQQTSDTTYRIYDWDRIDASGMKRELHTKEALDAIDFEVADEYKTRYKAKKNETVTLVQCPQFTTNLLEYDRGIAKDFEELDSFVIYMGVEGKSQLTWEGGEEEIALGDVVVIPNVINNIKLIPQGQAKLLEVYLT
jgi:mannose-6-phosphate isomerase